MNNDKEAACMQVTPTAQEETKTQKAEFLKKIVGQKDQQRRDLRPQQD